MRAEHSVKGAEQSWAPAPATVLKQPVGGSRTTFSTEAGGFRTIRAKAVECEKNLSLSGENPGESVQLEAVTLTFSANKKRQKSVSRCFTDAVVKLKNAGANPSVGEH